MLLKLCSGYSRSHWIAERHEKIFIWIFFYCILTRERKLINVSLLIACRRFDPMLFYRQPPLCGHPHPQFPIVGGAWEGIPPPHPHPIQPFFSNSPSPYRNRCPLWSALRPLKNEAPPHWNRKHPFMKWFLVKAQ